ncbi:MAG: hypothetical protein K2K34_05935 [Oscillospiraceae bacterium]|nr:hypothetical protein [Oscillospiraceae bacterium]
MRKSEEIKEKLIFTAAVICTAIASILIIAVIILQDAYVIKSAAVVAIICFLLWEFHYSITHDSLGRKIKPSVQPVYKKTAQEYKPPKGRFVFSEDTVLGKMGKIAERFKLEMTYKIERDQFGTPYHFVVCFAGKCGFKIRIHNRGISILAHSLISCEFINCKNCYHYYYFELVDDSLDSFKAQMCTDYEYTYQSHEFSSDIFFDNLSDDEIFNIVEKIIEALYGARSMKYETTEADDGKESIIFYLDAPDYYGYTETTEIGNFKFILNKENGGNQNG